MLQSIEGVAVDLLVEQDKAVRAFGGLDRPVHRTFAVLFDVVLGEEILFQELAQVTTGCLLDHFLGLRLSEHQFQRFANQGRQIAGVVGVEDGDAVR